MGRREDTELDRELAVLPPELRWREWMRRIEAVLFASTTPVAREDLARVVGQGASVDLLIEDLAVDLEGRPYEVAQVGKAWMLRTRAAYAPAIRAAADVGGQALNLSEYDLAVLAAIAYHQPVSRDGLKDIFGKEIKGCLSRRTGLAMAFRLMMSAQKKWRKLDGQNRLPEIVQGIEFRDGLRQLQTAA